MPIVKVVNNTGKEVGEIELSDTVFGIVPNKSVIYDAVIMQQASKRSGTHAVKGRDAVSGGGRKPWKQKGTGRARQGSTRSPQWRGGGVVFGPTPRSYAYKLPKKVRRLAIKSALSLKVLEDDIIVLNKLEFEAPKTKEMVELLKALKVDQKVLVVANDEDMNAYLSARNIPGVKFIRPNYINVLDLIAYDKLVITEDAVAVVEEVFA